jgi:3-hydroxyacyl-[acyl-carrier-protein] dehydratase
MTAAMKTSLELGADVVQRLIPHRRPLLMVDHVGTWEEGETPSLTAARSISANEPVFDGHFPGLHLWPGVYTIEGLLQTCNLLHIIWVARAHVRTAGGEPDEVFAALKNMELGYRLSPAYKPELTKKYEPLFGAEPDPVSRGGLAGAIDVKLLAPVFAGQRLEYRVTLSRVFDALQRYEVEATVEGKSVAKGVLTSSRGLVRMPAGP